jgi:methylenetetrahydrofolate dehydrogenase (NADP+)/methenyltetrahydrofolate cyclohydrolase
MNYLDPETLATFHRDDVRSQITQKGRVINVVGFLSSDDKSSKTYAEYTRAHCESVGVHFNLITAKPEDVGGLIRGSNKDASIHGIFVYYPIFGDARDSEIRDLVTPYKDVEGLTSHWMRKLYSNERFDDPQRQTKALLPCTPLAVLKLLEETEAHSETGLPFSGQTVTIFNRSAVVGKPLAHMLCNDGAKVHSFDIDGGITLEKGRVLPDPIEREEALAESGVVITAIPSRDFEKIKAVELKDGAVCVNVASIQNFEDEAKEKAGIYVPRVGPLTVAMCLRNVLRLFENHHSPEAKAAAHAS